MSVPVLCTMRFTEGQLARLRAVSPTMSVVQETCHNAEEAAKALKNHSDIKVLYAFDLPTNVLELAPGLGWVQLHSAGADHLLEHPIM